MRRRKVAVVVSTCSVVVVLSLLFLYFSEFPFFHQSDVMTVGQLNIGINYWRNFYEGRTVTVRGTLETIILPDEVLPYNGLLKGDSLNGTGAIPINLNWTQASSLLGKDVIVKGIVSDGGSYVYIEAELVYDARIWALLHAF